MTYYYLDPAEHPFLTDKLIDFKPTSVSDETLM